MPAASNYPVTELLIRWRQGDSSAQDQLFPIIYDQLRRMARKRLAGQGSEQTLQPTALVHEAYLRLVQPEGVTWQNRAHFFAVAARMMRQILVDHSRRYSAAKRGGKVVTLVFEEEFSPKRDGSALDLIALDNALQQLAALDARQSQIVDLRFFGGLSIEETAEVVDVSPATAKREWTTARIWLHQTLSGDTAP